MALFNDMVETDTLAAADEILIHQGTTDKRIPFEDAANLAYASRTGYTFLGNHVVGTSYISLESYAVYGGRAYWPKETTSLPYSSTTVNPANDAKLDSVYYKDAQEAYQIDENTADIATNAAAISAVQSQANTNASNIASNDSDIATLRTDVNDNTTDIATNATNIATNLTKINSNTAKISALEANETQVRGGSYSIPAGGTKTITFSSSFPSSCVAVTLGRTFIDAPKVISKNVNSVTLENASSQSTATGYYIAMGY